MYKYKSLQAGQIPREHLPLLQNLSHVQNVITLLTPMEKCPTSIEELLLGPKFNKCNSSVTRDKEICLSYVIMR